MPKRVAKKIGFSRSLFCLALIMFNIVAMGAAIHVFNTLGYLSAGLVTQTAIAEQSADHAKVLERVLMVTTGIPSRGGVVSRSIEVIATAYTPDDGDGDGIAADGRPVVPYRSIAVDPAVIAAGSKVYVPGFGVMNPHDTGGAIQGNRIDICLPTKDEAYNWGVRRLKVLIFKDDESKPVAEKY